MSESGNTIFVVEDDLSVLRSLDRLLRGAGFAVQGFASAQAFLDGHDFAAPGCALFDVAMEGMDGLELQRLMAQSGRERPVIFLSGVGDIPMTVQAMRAGAISFLTKPVATEELLAAVRLALDKDGAVRRRRAEVDAIRGRMALLTPRESQVLRGIVAGRLNKQIAADLGTVEKTVKVHRARVMAKMAVMSLADLVRLYERATTAGSSEAANDAYGTKVQLWP